MYTLCMKFNCTLDLFFSQSYKLKSIKFSIMLK